MPLAPPVTTTTLPATCIVTSRFCLLSGQNQIEHGRIVACRAQQHETMPDDVLEAQSPPGVKDHAQAIQRAAGEHKPERQVRQCRNDGTIERQAAPAERKIEPDGQAVETAGPAELEHDAEDRNAPYPN